MKERNATNEGRGKGKREEKEKGREKGLIKFKMRVNILDKNRRTKVAQ